MTSLVPVALRRCAAAPHPLSCMLFNGYLQWHSYNLLVVHELAPDLVAARLWKCKDKANIRAIDNAGFHHPAGRHWADGVDMRENRASAITRDHMPTHTQPGLQVGHGLSIVAEAEC